MEQPLSTRKQPIHSIRSNMEPETYRWQISAYDTNGSIIAQTSPLLIFFIAPTEMTTEPTTVTEKLVLDWNPVPSASSYRLKVSTTSTFETTLLDTKTTDNAVCACRLSPGTYYWQVFAYDVTGNIIASTLITSFTVISGTSNYITVVLSCLLSYHKYFYITFRFERRRTFGLGPFPRGIHLPSECVQKWNNHYRHGNNRFTVYDYRSGAGNILLEDLSI